MKTEAALQQDPYQLLSDTYGALLNTIYEPQTLILLLGPACLLLLIASIFFVWILVHRRKEQASLAEHASGTQASAPAPASEASAEKNRDEHAVPPQQTATSASPKPVPWTERLRNGLTLTRGRFSSLSGLFGSPRKIDDDLLESIHEALYKADVGVATADRLVASLQTNLNGNELEWADVQGCLQDEITSILAAPDKPLNQPSEGPWVVLIVGVNGVGKTTTIAKLTANFQEAGKSVLLCAADTYRAAAIDQLKVWAERLGVDVVAKQPGSDPASVAYEGVKAAIARKKDVLLIDTAGRLHNKKELMDELNKINRVIGKDLPDAPHETWLVIDATTGQNALMQIKAFKDVVALSGLVVTKLDGTAKGGVVIGASDQYQLPIRFVGVGEKAEDLRPFKAEDFSGSLF